MKTIVKAAIIHNGKVYTGWRHCFIIRDISESIGGKAIGSGGQGFIDSDGNYVTREEACKIALESGQITKPKYQPDIIFSEELWENDGSPLKYV